MQQNLELFLKEEVSIKLSQLKIDSPNTFGKMNVLQMLEHLAEWISISSGKIHFPLQTPDEQLPKWKAFLLSDKEMRPNTPNSLMSDEPPTPKIKSVEEGIKLVELEIANYFKRFCGKENETETHPFFGPLNFEEWAILHGKHIRHHMRQFSIEL